MNSRVYFTVVIYATIGSKIVILVLLVSKKKYFCLIFYIALNWSLTLKFENWLAVFENRRLRKAFWVYE